MQGNGSALTQIPQTKKLSKLPLRPNIDGSSTFSAGEIENLQAFITKLTSKNGITKYLNSKLTKATRQQLEKFDGSGQQKHTMAISLTELLNSIIKGSSIYDVKRFKGVVLRPETRRMLDENPQGEALVRLHHCSPGTVE